MIETEATTSSLGVGLVQDTALPKAWAYIEGFLFTMEVTVNWVPNESGGSGNIWVPFSPTVVKTLSALQANLM